MNKDRWQEKINVLAENHYAVAIHNYDHIVCTKCGSVKIEGADAAALVENTLNYNENGVFYNGKPVVIQKSKVSKCPSCLEVNFSNYTRSHISYVEAKETKETITVEAMIVVNKIDYQDSSKNVLNKPSNIITITLDKQTKAVYFESASLYFSDKAYVINTLIDGTKKDEVIEKIMALPPFIFDLLWLNLSEDVSEKTLEEWGITKDTSNLIDLSTSMSRLLFFAYLPYAASLPKEFNFQRFNINPQANERLHDAKDELAFYRGFMPALSKKSKEVLKVLIGVPSSNRQMDSFFLGLIERPEALNKILAAYMEQKYEIMLRTRICQTGEFEEDDILEEDLYQVNDYEAAALLSRFLYPGSIDNYINNLHKRANGNSRIFTEGLEEYFEMMRDTIRILKRIENGKEEIFTQVVHYERFGKNQSNKMDEVYELLNTQKNRIECFYNKGQIYRSVKMLHDAASSVQNGMVTQWEQYYIDDKDEALEQAINGYEFKWIRDTTQLCDIGEKMELCVASYYMELSECMVGIMAVYKGDMPVLCMEYDTSYRQFTQIKKKNNKLLKDSNGSDQALIQALATLLSSVDIQLNTRDIKETSSLHAFSEMSFAS